MGSLAFYLQSQVSKLRFPIGDQLPIVMLPGVKIRFVVVQIVASHFSQQAGFSYQKVYRLSKFDGAQGQAVLPQ